MARKAKDILLARGYTDADLASMATLLADAKFCAAIEAEAAELDQHRADLDKAKKDLEDDAKWYQETAVPALNKATQDAITARKKQAELEAQLKAAQDYGLLKVADGQDKGNPPVNPNPNPNPSPDSSLDASKFVSVDEFNNTRAAFGSAIAMAQDIADDHRELFGTRLPGGVTKLREEYQDAVSSRRYRGSLQQFWEEKYKVADKRNEIAAKSRQDEIDKAVADAKSKWISEQSNPMTRTPSSSRNPFVARTATTTAPDGKTVTAPVSKPWERNESERSGQRVSKFTGKVLQSA